MSFISQKRIKKVYKGSTQIRPNPYELVNGDINDSNTEYLTVSPNSGAGPFNIYGWIGSKTGDWTVGGPIKYGTSVQIASTSAPRSDPAGSTTGGCIGVYCAWGGSLKYTQDITLPAGTYTFTYYYYKNASYTMSQNYCGVIVGGTNYYDSVFSTYGSWVARSVQFTLSSSQTVTASIGYLSINAGSASQPRIFFDNISISRVS